MHLLPLAGTLVLGLAACNTSPAGTPPATSSPAVARDAAPPTAGAPVAPASVVPAAGGTVFSGTIAEAMNAGDYTYARLQGASKEVWIAGSRFDAKVGTPVSVSLDLPMENFESKTLNRTFPMLYFVSEVALDGQPLRVARPAAPPAMMNSHGAGSADAGQSGPVARIAPPPGGLAVADVFAKATALSGKPVIVRGTVVKFNGGIMDRNWLHIQDGSGSAESGTHDLTVTTGATAKVGDVLTLSGVLGTKKDFGAGYAYDVILEAATVTP